MQVWLGTGTGGALVDEVDARISVLDHGYTVGEGVFETMKLVSGRVFLWPWHLERLHQSAAILGLTPPDDAVLTDAVRACAAANAAAIDGVGRLRLTMSCSNGPLNGNGDAGVTIVCTAFPAKPAGGVATLRIADWPRNERNPLVHAKSTSYVENVLAMQRAQDSGATDALFLNTAGLVSECTTSNVFVVADGVVRTPRVTDGLLAGVTRRLVLGLGGDGLRIEEAAITRADLERADEVFLTSSLRDIQPVTRIDGNMYEVGPATAELRRRFTIAAASDEHWL